MISMQLSQAELDLLRELLESEIPELRDEIWHTDDHDFRESLKQRQKLIESLLAKVREAGPA